MHTSKVVNIIYIFAFVKTKDDIIIYLFRVAFFGLINNLSYWISVPKYINRPILNELHPSKHIKTVIALFVPTIAMQVYTVLDKTIFGVINQNAWKVLYNGCTWSNEHSYLLLFMYCGFS
ncbi:hypothetical protein DW177_01130 [Blautia sp. AM16-16B]|nr:hypothetical protein DW177_01130 [Blautia sp. AM16-16B]